VGNVFLVFEARRFLRATWTATWERRWEEFAVFEGLEAFSSGIVRYIGKSNVDWELSLQFEGSKVRLLIGARLELEYCRGHFPSLAGSVIQIGAVNIVNKAFTSTSDEYALSTIELLEALISLFFSRLAKIVPKKKLENYGFANESYSSLTKAHFAKLVPFREL